MSPHNHAQMFHLPEHLTPVSLGDKLKLWDVVKPGQNGCRTALTFIFFCISHIYLTATAFYFCHKHSYFCTTRLMQDANCCFMLSLLCTDGFYVTWAASEGAVMAPGQSLPPHGKQLGCLDSADLKEIIQKVHSKEPCSQPWRKYLVYHFSCALLSCRAWHCTAVITGSWISSSSGRCMTLCPAWIGS